MSPRRAVVRAGVAGAVVAAALALAGCGGGGDLAFRNDGDRQVTVSSGDISEVVVGHGGMVLLDYGCTSDDVVITFDDGASVTLDGPVCPPSSIVIRAGSAEVVGAEG